MAITFDTLEELILFSESFALKKEQSTQSKKERATPNLLKKTKAHYTSTPTGMVDANKTIETPIKPPADSSQTELKTELERKSSPKPTNKKKEAEAIVSPSSKKVSLTTKIQEAIQERLTQDLAFTANDIFDDLYQADPATPMNRQSVITSVLKQMNSTFASTAVELVPGNGPRPVKLYNP